MNTYRTVSLFSLFLLIQMSDLNTVYAQPESKGWKEIEIQDGSSPVARHEAGFARVGRNFYLLGGRGIKPVSIYDTGTGSWSQGSAPPIEIHHFQAVVYKKKIYIIGAFTGTYPAETPVEEVLIYDPATDTWTEDTTIPAPRRRGAAGACVYRNKIYVAGGLVDGHRGEHTAWLDAYDPRTGEWLVLPDAPHARDHHQAVAAKGRIYLLGGRRSQAGENVFGDTEPAVDVFDFRTGGWSTLAEDLPTARAGNAAILYDKKYILVLGGESDTQQPAHAETEAFNLKTGQWENWSPLNAGRHGTGVVVYRGKLYIASGSGNRGGGPELTSMEVFGEE